MCPVDISPQVTVGKAVALVSEFSSRRAERKQAVPSMPSAPSKRQAFDLFDPIAEGHLF
jgi:hypothetical protein